MGDFPWFSFLFGFFLSLLDFSLMRAYIYRLALANKGRVGIPLASILSRVCDKIKQLIFDQGVIMEYANLKSVPADTGPSEEQQQVLVDQTSNTPGLKRKSLFSNLQNDQRYPKKKTADQHKFITEEIMHYLKDDDNDSMVLLRSTASISYETLSKLATKYLCIPAPSASVERIFSQSGFIFRPHRARMSRKTLQQLTLLKCNSEI